MYYYIVNSLFNKFLNTFIKLHTKLHSKVIITLNLNFGIDDLGNYTGNQKIFFF